MLTLSLILEAVSPLPSVLIRRYPTASLRQVLPMVDSTSEYGIKPGDEVHSISSSSPECIAVWMRVVDSLL